jgi:hypothetical protein
VQLVLDRSPVGELMLEHVRRVNARYGLCAILVCCTHQLCLGTALGAMRRLTIETVRPSFAIKHVTERLGLTTITHSLMNGAGSDGLAKNHLESNLNKLTAKQKQIITAGTIESLVRKIPVVIVRTMRSG